MSQTRSRSPVAAGLALRLVLLAAALLALAAISAALAQRADAGAAAILTVNSTSNTDDGQCNGPPNNNVVGNCTLREAIDDVNNGLADEIHFHPAVFPQSTHGVIQLELGLGALPPIIREVKIDAKGVGVVLDGDWDNDGVGVPWGILVIASHNGFDFELNGGGHTFIIQDIGCSNTVDGGGTGDSVAGPGPAPICRGGGGQQISPVVITPFSAGVTVTGFCGGDSIVHTGDGSSVSGGGLPICCQATTGDTISACAEGNQSVSGPPVFIGGPFSLGDVRIDGIEVHNAMNVDGIFMEATNMNNINITNSWIEADLSAIEIFAFSPPAPPDGRLTNNNVHINGNRITGGDGFVLGSGDSSVSGVKTLGSGVMVNFCCDVHSKITADVSNNESIVGNFGVGVLLGYCDGGGCAQADGSSWNFHVNDNGKISGNSNAVFVNIHADGNNATSFPHDGDDLNADVQVNGNAILDGATADGVGAFIDICCATSDSTGTISVSGNSDIVGDNDAVQVSNDVNEGPDNLAETHVDNNGELTGEGAHGVVIETLAGSDILGDTDSDENTALVTVNGNQDINGDNDNAIDILARSGKLGGPGDADRNATTVEVMDNENVDGDGDAVVADARAGTDTGVGDADDNTATVKVTGNGTLDGNTDQGVDVQAIAGHIADTPVPNVTGDGNATDVLVDNNDTIIGHRSDGVFVNSRAGGLGTTGEENHTATAVTNNNHIKGGQGGDGVHVEALVCCDTDNENGGQTNLVDISGNQNIIGTDGDGIDINRLCCSINTVLIRDNVGVIKGNDENGIEISPCLASGNPNQPNAVFDNDFTPLGNIPCMGDSVTALTITGNNISNSGLDGILICCGAFQLPINQAPAGISGPGLKSVIADNTISHNGEDGIDLDTTIGINIEHNDIFMNGTAATDGDNGVEIDWQVAFFIAGGTGCVAGDQAIQGQSPFCVKVPAHFNRISENSIYDNAGLGINLIGTQIDPVELDQPGAGTEVPGWPFVDGVGCIQYAFTPIGPNDCIPYPKILFTGGVTVAHLSGTACSSCLVEVFIADPTPADQTGPLGRQYGEGKTFKVSGQADALGAFNVELPCGMAAGELTATATDKLKNTSEFSANIPFPGTPACAAATALPADTPAPVEPTATPQPTATSVPPTAEPAGLCGDVNSDGAVNAIDATLILQLAAGYIDALPKGNDMGDVSNDGATNAIDAELILQSAAAMVSASGLSCS